MLEMLYSLIISPIEYIIEILFFVFKYKLSFDIISAIFFISIAINFFCLPLYNRADKIQEEELEKQKELEPTLKKIRKNFKGNEQYFLIKTLYRQHNYNPIMALRSSYSLLLQIPFFIAAYHFFSHLEIFTGYSYGIISDFSKPDGLLSIFNFKINILPIIMTFVNIISSEIYLQSKNLKSRIQPYAFALIFLILLYNSPAILVIYWTFNNLFSLIKNMGFCFKSQKKFIRNTIIAITIIIISRVIYCNLEYINKYMYSQDVYYSYIMIIFLGFIIYLYFGNINKLLSKYFKLFNVNQKQFLFITITIAIFVGLLIPSFMISLSNDFVSSYNINPVTFIFDNMLKVIGLYILWPLIIYSFIPKKFRYLLHIFATLILFLQVIMFCTYNSELGIISADFTFPIQVFRFMEICFDILMILAVLIIVIYLLTQKNHVLNKILFIIFITSIVYSSFNIVKLYNAYVVIKNNDSKYFREIKKPIKLSQNGKNVLIIFLDRAIGVYAKEIFENNENLRKDYAGFVLFPNTVSYYAQTVIAYLPMLGGYEYTPFNNITHENLEDKTNQAYMMLPKIFINNDFNATIINPHSFYDECDYNYKGSLNTYNNSHIDLFFIPSGLNLSNIEITSREENTLKILNEFKPTISTIKNNFFRLSNYIVMPKFLKIFSNYNQMSSKNNIWDKSSIENYTQLLTLKNYTMIDNSHNNYFTLLNNSLTHINKYDKSYHKEAFWIEAETLYLINEYINYLKKNNVYNNTRIIIVADHGWDYEDSKYLETNALRYNPLLLFKDFDKNGTLKEDMTFMTNADTPILATQDIIPNPINPYTGKNIKDCVNKENVKILSGQSGNATNARATLRPDMGSYHTVHDNIFNHKNWEFVNDKQMTSKKIY